MVTSGIKRPPSLRTVTGNKIEQIYKLPSASPSNIPTAKKPKRNEIIYLNDQVFIED